MACCRGCGGLCVPFRPNSTTYANTKITRLNCTGTPTLRSSAAHSRAMHLCGRQNFCLWFHFDNNHDTTIICSRMIRTIKELDLLIHLLLGLFGHFFAHCGNRRALLLQGLLLSLLTTQTAQHRTVETDFIMLRLPHNRTAAFLACLAANFVLPTAFFAMQSLYRRR